MQADADLIFPNVSSDAAGRFVVFSSSATNLGNPKSNALPEVYLLDRTSGVITAESRYPFEEPNGGSYFATVSADGSRVSFQSTATNLVLGDANGLADIFVHDRPSDLIQLASTSSGLEQADSNSPTSAISADGNYIAFESNGTNLVTPDTNGTLDVFTRRDRAPDRCGQNASMARSSAWSTRPPSHGARTRFASRGRASARTSRSTSEPE